MISLLMQKSQLKNQLLINLKDASNTINNIAIIKKLLKNAIKILLTSIKYQNNTLIITNNNYNNNFIIKNEISFDVNIINGINIEIIITLPDSNKQNNNIFLLELTNKNDIDNLNNDLGIKYIDNYYIFNDHDSQENYFLNLMNYTITKNNNIIKLTIFHLEHLNRKHLLYIDGQYFCFTIDRKFVGWILSCHHYIFYNHYTIKQEQLLTNTMIFNIIIMSNNIAPYTQRNIVYNWQDFIINNCHMFPRTKIKQHYKAIIPHVNCRIFQISNIALQDIDLKSNIDQDNQYFIKIKDKYHTFQETNFALYYRSNNAEKNNIAHIIIEEDQQLMIINEKQRAIIVKCYQKEYYILQGWEMYYYNHENFYITDQLEQKDQKLYIEN